MCDHKTPCGRCAKNGLVCVVAPDRRTFRYRKLGVGAGLASAAAAAPACPAPVPARWTYAAAFERMVAQAEAHKHWTAAMLAVVPPDDAADAPSAAPAPSAAASLIGSVSTAA